jgi:hypothetical protein
MKVKEMETAFKPVRKKLLTKPIMKMELDQTRYIKITEPMYVGKPMPVKEGEKQKEPATLINVINLETGEPAQIVANKVLKSVLTEEYPEAGYVNKCFAVTKQAKQPGRDYNRFLIEEIEDPAQENKAGDNGSEAVPSKAAQASTLHANRPAARR